MFQKASIDEITKIYTQASNIKKTLQDRVISEKIGDLQTAADLERQYKPLASVLGLKTDQPAGPDDISADGKKVLRLADLLDNVLKNINVTNQTLSAQNPDYISQVATPGIQPTLNIAQLAANTLARIAQLRTGIDTVQGDTSSISNHLLDLNKAITENKLDLDNVEAKLTSVYDEAEGSSIEPAVIDEMVSLFRDKAKEGFQLTPLETEVISDTLRTFLNSRIGLNVTYSQIKTIIDSLKINDRRTLELLGLIDTNITTLSAQNKDLADKLDNIPDGLAAVLGDIPAEIGQAVADIVRPVDTSITDTDIAASIKDPSISAATMNLWRIADDPQSNKSYDLIPSRDKTLAVNKIGPMLQIGQTDQYIRADLLVGNSPVVELYDKMGLPLAPSIIKISPDTRDFLITPAMRLGSIKTMFIPEEDRAVLKPYYTKIKKPTRGATGSKIEFLTGTKLEFRYRNNLAGQIIEPPKVGNGASTRFGLMNPDGIFGNIWINPQRLGYGRLDVHKLRVGTPLGKSATKYGLGVNIAEKPILRANIDGDLINLLTKRYNKKHQYSPLSIDLFKRLSELAGYNDMTARGKGTKRTLLTKGSHAASDPSGKIIKIISDPNELIERMALLVGSIEAGNMSPVLRAELGEIADILLNKQMIDRAAHKTIFEKYILSAI